MKNSDVVKKELLTLDFKKKVLFGMSCISRTKKLYNLFEEEVQNNNYNHSRKFQNGLIKIVKIVEKLDMYIFDDIIIKHDDLIKYINQIEEILPSYEEYSSYQSTIAVNVGLIIKSVLKFLLYRDESIISELNDFLLELVNIIKSERFYQKNSDASFNDCEIYLQKFFEDESFIELELIDKLRNNFSKEDYDEFNNNTEIKF